MLLNRISVRKHITCKLNTMTTKVVLINFRAQLKRNAIRNRVIHIHEHQSHSFNVNVEHGRWSGDGPQFMTESKK